MSHVTLHLDPSTEQKLRAKATRAGTTLEAFLLTVFQSVAADETPAETPPRLPISMRLPKWEGDALGTLSREEIYGDD